MNILFLCTANKHRSRTFEDYYRAKCSGHHFKSAGLSQKLCEKFGTTLCSGELLAWAEQIFVMEERHKERIAEHTGDIYLNKITVLHIEDIYHYMQIELLDELQSHEQLRFLNL
jgi:predicted protein tyrosine phosphatase